jgi:hypothetical protein
MTAQEADAFWLDAAIELAVFLGLDAAILFADPRQVESANVANVPVMLPDDVRPSWITGCGTGPDSCN